MTNQTPTDPTPARSNQEPATGTDTFSSANARGPRASAAGPGCAAFVPAVLLALAIPVCAVLQGLAGWAQSDSCAGNQTGCYPPGIVALAPLSCLVAATIASFLAPLPFKKSRTGVTYAVAAAGLFLVAVVTLGVDLNWGSA
jgi:hypothetical protein